MRIVIIKKNRLWVFLGILIVILLITIFTERVNETSNEIQFRKVILLDAGHGGIDGGAVGKKGSIESKINLAITLRLRELLEQSGMLVLLTREKDEGLYTEDGTVRKKKNEDLRNRRNLREESKPDLFISIHMNSFPQEKYYGAQAFYPKNNDESKKVAEFIQEEMIRVIDNGNKRVAKEKNNVYIMKNCTVPTVLVECGFLSNPKEEMLLQQEKYQEKMAWSIYIGILRYFNESSLK